MPAKNLGPFTGRQLTTIIVAVIAAVAIPTAAYAVAATHVVVQDQLTKTPAGVTPTGNLKVAEAAPSAFFQSGEVLVGSGASAVVALPPAGSALILTSIHVDTFADPTPGSNQFIALDVKTGTTCTGSRAGTYFQFVNPASIGEIDIPLAPGLGVPAGDALCAITFGSVQANASVSGYTVPAGTVAAGSSHALPPLSLQR